MIKPSSKSEFVRSLPEDAPIAEVVARAQQIGMTISPRYVSNIRSEARPRARETPPLRRDARPRRTTANAARTARSTGAVSKSDFIRAQDRSMSAAEVVTAAKREGITLSPELVYKVRGRTNASARKTVPHTTGSLRANAATNASDPTHGARATFRSAIRDMIRRAVDDYGADIERRLVVLLTEDEPSLLRREAALSIFSNVRAGAVRRESARPAAAKKPRRARTKAHPSSASQASSKTRSVTKASAPRAIAPSTTSDDHSYRPRILAALDAAPDGLSRSQLIRVLELKPSEEARFGTALVALRGSSAVVLEGMRKQAVYRRAVP